MKKPLNGLLIVGLSFLLLGIAWGDQEMERSEKLPTAIKLLPMDNDIRGWTRSNEILKASKDEELYKLLDGGAALYIKHGFQSYVGQSYKGPKGLELEVYIFDQGTPQNAEDLYEDPFTKPSRSKEIANLGEKARIDESALFCYGVELIQERFYVRVIIQDKTEEGRNVAILFARHIVARIKTLTISSLPLTFEKGEGSIMHERYSPEDPRGRFK